MKVNGKDDIPYIMENESHDWNHQPDSDSINHYQPLLTTLNHYQPLFVHGLYHIWGRQIDLPKTVTSFWWARYGGHEAEQLIKTY